MRMNIRRSPKQMSMIPPEFIERCLELGLVSWRLDLNGMPVEDPSGPAMIGMWLSTRRFMTLLSKAAMSWTSQDSLNPEEIYPGIWLIPLAETHRDRRTGYFVSIGFGPDVLESEHLDEGCDGNQLQIIALRHLLKDRAVFDHSLILTTRSILSWMLSDLKTIKKSSETIELFSEQLGDSYEVVTTLEELGRSMGAIKDTTEIIKSGITEIASTLDYNWVACVINGEHDITNVLDQLIHQAGTTQLAESEIQQVLTQIRTTDPAGIADMTKIFPVTQTLLDLEPQILVHPIEHEGEEYGLLIAGGKNGDDPQVSSHETKLLESISGMLGACLENAELYYRQHQTFIGTIHALSAAIDAKDQYTQGHSERVAMLSEMLARKIGYSDLEAERIRISGLVHDVGKIGVAESVLCKPGRLTNEEFDIIKTHPRVGYDIMKTIPDLHDILPGVLHHHERWDGNGYPDKLGGQDIPHMARIMAIADTFDAMSSNRAYRSGLSRERVFKELRACKGTQFDPDLVEPFLELDFEIYDSMVAKHKSQDPINKAA